MRLIDGGFLDKYSIGILEVLILEIMLSQIYKQVLRRYWTLCIMYRADEIYPGQQVPAHPLPRLHQGRFPETRTELEVGKY